MSLLFSIIKGFAVVTSLFLTAGLILYGLANYTNLTIVIIFVVLSILAGLAIHNP